MLEFYDWRELPTTEPQKNTAPNGYSQKHDYRPDFEKRGGRGYSKAEWDAMLRGKTGTDKDLLDQPTFDSYTGETVYPDGRREPGQVKELWREVER